MALFAMPILQLNMKRTYDGTSSTETEGDVVICSFLKLTALHSRAISGIFAKKCTFGLITKSRKNQSEVRDLNPSKPHKY